MMKSERNIWKQILAVLLADKLTRRYVTGPFWKLLYENGTQFFKECIMNFQGMISLPTNNLHLQFLIRGNVLEY